MTENRGEAKNIVHASKGIKPNQTDKSGAARHPGRKSARSFLFLQGPHGPFFHTFSEELRRRGFASRTVALNGGDLLNRRFRADAFTGSLDEWSLYLRDEIARYGVTDVVLYGERRPYHSPVRALAEIFQVRVWVFEEGYIRPGWVVLEKNGVNANSSVPRIYEGALKLLKSMNGRKETAKFLSREFGLREQAVDTVPLPNPMRHRVFLAINYYTGILFLTPFFFWFFWHRPHKVCYEISGWALHALRGMIHGEDDLAAIARLRESGRRYFIFPLQLSTDAQIVCASPFRDVLESIEIVCSSFKRCADPDTVLLIKQHPLESSFLNLRSYTNNLARALGIEDRVVFIAEGTNELVAPAAGCVVVNSTMGILALMSSRPTIALGSAIYCGEGLAVKGFMDSIMKVDMPKLDAFWTNPVPPQPKHVDLLVKILNKHACVEGNFYTEEGIETTILNSMERMGIGGVRNAVIFSKGISRIRNLDLFLDGLEEKTAVGWGNKKTARKAMDYAAALELPYCALEDGFIKTYATDLPEYALDRYDFLSMVVDRHGIFYDPFSGSDLERYLTDTSWFDGELREKTVSLLRRLNDLGINKYNPSGEAPAALPEDADPGKCVLLVDQTRNDTSVLRAGLGTGRNASFEVMLRTALAEYGPGRVFVKAHPFALAKGRRTYLGPKKLKGTGARLLGPGAAPPELLRRFAGVWTVCSSMGLDALIAGARVRCFGLPFYYGYGLTEREEELAAFPYYEDAVTRVRANRGGKRAGAGFAPLTLEELAAACYYRYSVFVNPFTRKKTGPEEIVDLIAHVGNLSAKK